MISWLQLSDEQRKAVIDEAELLSNITAKVIEKDWWVTLTLKALFQSAYHKHMVFKGGTSLSKGWNLISRFSEDIDISLDPEAFGIKYLENPSGEYVKKLKRNGCEFTSTKLMQELIKQLKDLGLPEGIVMIYAQPVRDKHPDTDPQILFLKYPSLYKPNEYIKDEVKIEVGVRSLRIPFSTVTIQSLLFSINPKPAYAEVPFPVEIVEPRKTFLEKMFLLHEEFSRVDKTKIKTSRMSRHLYDLFKIMHTQILGQALTDHDLYNQLIRHRQWYNRISYVDYATLEHSTIAFIPTSEVIEDYRKDYETMQEQMIYEVAVSFDDVINSLKILQGKLRLKYQKPTLEEIIALAKEKIINSKEFNPSNNGNWEVNIVDHSNQNLPRLQNKKNIYTVSFQYQNQEFIFEKITVA